MESQEAANEPRISHNARRRQAPPSDVGGQGAKGGGAAGRPAPPAEQASKQTNEALAQRAVATPSAQPRSANPRSSQDQSSSLQELRERQERSEDASRGVHSVAQGRSEQVKYTWADAVRSDLIRYHLGDIQGPRKHFGAALPANWDKMNHQANELAHITAQASLEPGYARELNRVAPGMFKKIVPQEMRDRVAAETKVDAMYAAAAPRATPYGQGKAEVRGEREAANASALQGQIAAQAAAQATNQPSRSRARAL